VRVTRFFANRKTILVLLALAAAAFVILFAGQSNGGPEEWRGEFPNTDFSKTIIDLDEIVTDGPTRDSIPPIHDPQFVAAADADTLGPLEPVISVVIDGDARAYPLRILLWHEIVNDVVGGVPILVSYCPLCNSGIVFDRRLDGELLVFGNTGRIRHYDMVMYDHNTESWWQQFLGEAVIGALSGKRLDMISARLESLQRFRERAPDGRVLVPNDPSARPYGRTPYINYEAGSPRAIAAAYRLPVGVRVMQRVVIVGEEAWTLEFLRKAGTHRAGDLVFEWQPGQNSIHDRGAIAMGRDVGNVVVQRMGPDGLRDTPYDVAFAFAFKAFHPDGQLHEE
jgi:hypothetical protein